MTNISDLIHRLKASGTALDLEAANALFVAYRAPGEKLPDKDRDGTNNPMVPPDPLFPERNQDPDHDDNA